MANLYSAKRSAPQAASAPIPADAVVGKGELGTLLASLMKVDPSDGQTHQLMSRAQGYWNNTTTSLITKPPAPVSQPFVAIKVKLVVAEDVDDAELQRVVLDEEEAKWKRKAEERRQQLKKGGFVYNKSIMQQMLSKGPVGGPGFAAGRGKPIRIGA